MFRRQTVRAASSLARLPATQARSLSQAAPGRVTLRPSAERGKIENGWLNARYTFAFADYWSKEFHNFNDLRAINEDRIAPSKGFAEHPHHDFEIFSYMVSGALRHKDSMNNAEVVPASEVQFTSAGTGIRHSEFNASDSEYAHLLQLWVRPNQKNLKPNYQTQKFDAFEKDNKLCLFVGPENADPERKAITINQDMFCYCSLLSKGCSITHTVKPGRSAYLHLVMDATGYNTEARKTALLVNGTRLAGGDGAFITSSGSGSDSGAGFTITIQGGHADADGKSEFVLFDMANRDK